MTNPLRKLWRAGTSSNSRFSNSEIRPFGNTLLPKDRRVIKRQFHPLAATVRYGLAGTEEKVEIYNFSDKGLCFHCAVRLPLGAAVEVVTTLPRSQGLSGRKVRYLAHIVRVTVQRDEFVTAALIFRCDTLADEQPRHPSVDACAEKAQAQAANSGNSASSPNSYKPRRFSRYSCATRVQFRTPGSNEIVSGELGNLSLAGCYVQTSQPCPPGACVEIVVQAGRARIHAQGQVKAVKENRGMAVEFTGDLPERLQRLPRLVQMVSAARHCNH